MGNGLVIASIGMVATVINDTKAPHRRCYSMVTVAESNCATLWGHCGDVDISVHIKAVWAATRIVFGCVPVFLCGQGFGHCLSESEWSMYDNNKILYIRIHWLMVKRGLQKAEVPIFVSPLSPGTQEREWEIPVWLQVSICMKVPNQCTIGGESFRVDKWRSFVVCLVAWLFILVWGATRLAKYLESIKIKVTLSDYIIVAYSVMADTSHVYGGCFDVTIAPNLQETQAQGYAIM